MLIGGVTSGESNDHLVRLLHILVANETNMGLNASNRPLFPAPLGDTKYIENHRRWAGEMPGIGANDKRCPPNRFQACGRIIVHARHGSLFIQRDSGNSDDRRRSRSNSRRVPGQRSHIGRRRHPSALCPIQVIPIKALSENSAELEHYSNFGSRSFTDVSWMKISFIRQLLELHPHVIYSDLDISWIRNPLPYLSQVAETYPIAFQTEALPRFPPAICCGFASFAKSDRTFALLDALITFHSTQIDNDERLDDQAACQRLIENDVRWLRDIFCLPEGLFLNGLGYRNLQNAGESPCPIEGELLPFLFHANWTMGIENKYRLLASTGTWLLDEAPQFDQATITPRRTQQPPLC